MRKINGKFLIGLLLGGFLIALALVVLIERSPPPAPLPNPNGFDDFLRAAPMVSAKVEDYPDFGRGALRTMLETNKEPLRLLRLGLTRRSAVPTALWGYSMRCRLLAMLLAAEGRQRELDNQPSEAAHSYIDCIHLGCDVSRGGIESDRLVGISFEAIGRESLVKLLPKLRCQEMRPLVHDLEQINSNEVSWEDVLHNEHVFVRTHVFETGNPITWIRALLRLDERSINILAKQEHDLAVAQLRLLTAELALRCYRAEQGQSPLRLNQLVPKYLQEVPSDPFGANSLVYRQQGTNWLLYSIGPDGVDQGGKRIARIYSGDPSNPANPGDLFYDSRQ